MRVAGRIPVKLLAEEFVLRTAGYDGVSWRLVHSRNFAITLELHCGHAIRNRPRGLCESDGVRGADRPCAANIRLCELAISLPSW